jgi:protein tyrosine/serine phosphatase
MEAARLVAVLCQAPKPILIHCEGGADRSGLASEIYLSQVAHPGEATVET